MFNTINTQSIETVQDTKQGHNRFNNNKKDINSLKRNLRKDMVSTGNFKSIDNKSSSIGTISDRGPTPPLRSMVNQCGEIIDQIEEDSNGLINKEQPNDNNNQQ